MRAVKIKADGKAPYLTHVTDADTGETVEVTGIHVMIGVDKTPKVTLEMLAFESPLDIETEDFEINETHPLPTIKDKYGRQWVNAVWLAKTIREKGTMCVIGKDQHAVEHRFSDELLRNWETVETSPEEGHKPGDSNHG